MRIFLVSNMYPSEDDKTYGIFVKNFKEALEKKGVVFSSCALIRGRGTTFIEKIIKYFNFFLDVFRGLKCNNYDIIYIHYGGHSLLPFVLFEKFIKKPIVINLHGGDIYPITLRGKLINKLTDNLIKKANLIIVPSNYFKNIVKKKYAIKENKIFISPSGGIDIKRFKPINLKKDSIFTIGYVSRIDKGKGWDIFLKAVKILKDRKLGFKVIMIGDGKERDKLLKLIKNLKLKDIVKYVGAKSHKELPFYFNKMDIFVFPTILSESLGLVGLEAMACGVPVIGSNIGGLRDYIKDGVNGKFLRPGDIEDLAKCIEYFMNLDDKDFEKYKIAAIDTAKQYDKSLVSEELYFKLKEFEK